KPSAVKPDLPKGIEQVILKAMSKNPENRFRSARSMLRAVRILKENPMVVFEAKETSSAKEGNTNKPMAKKKITARAPQKRAKITFFPIILGIVMAFFSVLAISGIIVLITLFKAGTSSEDDVIYATVPSLVGQVYDESMKEEYLEEHFNIQVVYADTLNDAYGYGEIYNTKPSAGEVKKIKNSTGTTDLILYVNPVEGSALFPDYTIMTESAAKIALRRHGYNNVEVQKTSHDTVLAGYVYDTTPKAGELVSQSDIITLYVSTGKKLNKVISMPDLVGETKGQAMIELQNFEVEYVTVSSSSFVGTVVGQSITPYTVISPEFCDKIVLYISDGNGDTGIESDNLYLYMPSLVGKNIRTAEKELEKFKLNGIKITFKEGEEEAEVGIVTSQSIEPGERLMVNFAGEIVITYGTGITEPEPEPQPQPQPEPEPEPEPSNPSGPIVIV
ncbi:MAG: PASTA domain-containing protein, partial [Clostridia bacterium]|nr:PASTA domain-containing protein [Clostridia bacterium]